MKEKWKIQPLFYDKKILRFYMTDFPEILKNSFSFLLKTFNLVKVDMTFLEVNFSNVLLVLHLSPFTRL